MKFYIALFISLFSINHLYSQGGWSKWEELYSNNFIKVEISFKIKPCEDEESNNMSKFQYRISGKFSEKDVYLNWKMDYINCNGELYYQTNSLNIGRGSKANIGVEDPHTFAEEDYEFTCKSLETHFYDVIIATTKATGSDKKILEFSKDPESITGNLNTYMDEQTTLSVKGGVLGIGSKWVWYTESCGGTEIGKGSSIIVNPKQTTTYFVRAESNKNTTNCAKATVSVNQNSQPAASIEGNQSMCKGESTPLYLTGGKLGFGASWVWTKNSCDGEEVGRGSSITVSPEKPTTYFVKAVGKSNTTTCVQITVHSYERSIKPIQINTSKIACANEPITLSVSGGSLASDAQWKWYSDYCGSSSLVGSGKSIQVTAMGDKTYYVRAEGECNKTECINIHVAPDKISSPPYYISTSNLKSGKVQLSFYSGDLGKDAEWKWYKNDCGKGKPIGTGTSIKVHPRKQTYYYVRGEGICNTTSCVAQYVAPNIAHKFGPTFTDYKNNKYNNRFLHLGIGLGLDVTTFYAFVNRTQKTNGFGGGTTNSLNEMNITGFGAKGEFVFHPYMSDYFSFGIVTSGAVGTTPFVFAGGKKTIDDATTKEKYFYTRFEIGGEIAAGYSKVKALLIYKSSIQTHQYSASGSNYSFTNTYSFNKDIRKETFSGGIRVAPYSTENSRHKRGFCFDFIYSLSRDYSWKWETFDWNYNARSNWQQGAGMALWIQSILKLQVNALFNERLGSSTADYNKSSFQVSLIYNRNSFY